MTIQAFTRRLFLKLLPLPTISRWLGLGRSTPVRIGVLETVKTEPVSHWSNTHDRVWLGENFWANPMEDWAIVNGAAECRSRGGDRNIHLLTHQLTNPARPFEMSVMIQQVESGRQDSGTGFKIGVRSELNEHKSNAFAKNGIVAGCINGQLRINRKSKSTKVKLDRPTRFVIKGQPADGEQYQLTLSVGDESISALVDRASIAGNVALVNNFDTAKNVRQGGRYRFTDWHVGGEAFGFNKDHRFGPILWSMYSLSDSRGNDGHVMKISALTGPLGEQDSNMVELHTLEGNQFQSLGTAELDGDAWVATFRIPNWDATRETPYKLVYREKRKDGTEKPTSWTGTIKPEPSARPLRAGMLTCQKDYGFPYRPVVDNLIRLDPDLLYFSGDQIYESHGGYGFTRDPAEPAILCYLRKYYMFGWAFREAMKDRPTLVIPDDHDVFQGNIWGEGGAPMKDLDKGASSKGGYREPARMVNAVHKTCIAHHPDPFDPAPAKQDISVYYGDMVYGNVSFAILGDRQWKSGPERVDTGSGRADHVADPEFDCSKLDVPGLELLGDRQERFLDAWGDDWRGHTMKVLLSQTVFAGVATHHGKFDGYLKADLDSGGWPQTARNRAIRILRKSMSLHVCGDQHLTSLSQYGVEKQRDSNWAFCTPAIAAGYPRWWRPDDVGMPHENRPQHGHDNTGEYLDGFGNRVYVYAVGNPEVGKMKHRYELAHQKGSGFGLVTIDTEKRTYLVESFRFLVDATDGNPDNQFPGWPVTIHQTENRGENRLG